MRTKYWSSSKLAKVINTWAGINNPVALTQEGWKKHKEESKKINKYVYYLVDTLFDRVQGIVYWPADKLYSIFYWYSNRFVDKVYTPQTGLNPNRYYEIDGRVLHALFNTLVVFIEGEKAWMEYISNPEKYNIPWYKTNRWLNKLSKFQYPELGLAYLEWEKGLKYDTDWVGEDSPKLGQPTPQAETAWELYRLYHWWKEVYPNRTDIYGEDYDTIRALPEYWNVVNRIEVEFSKEDTDMMIRLIKILPGMWT